VQNDAAFVLLMPPPIEVDLAVAPIAVLTLHQKPVRIIDGSASK
jgi:hypothetical protein